jgi:hypothetical protein
MSVIIDRLLTKMDYVNRLLAELPNIKFNANLFNSSQLITYTQAERWPDIHGTGKRIFLQIL